MPRHITALSVSLFPIVLFHCSLVPICPCRPPVIIMTHSSLWSRWTSLAHLSCVCFCKSVTACVGGGESVLFHIYEHMSEQSLCVYAQV